MLSINEVIPAFAMVVIFIMAMLLLSGTSSLDLSFLTKERTKGGLLVFVESMYLLCIKCQEVKVAWCYSFTHASGTRVPQGFLSQDVGCSLSNSCLY